MGLQLPLWLQMAVFDFGDHHASQCQFGNTHQALFALVGGHVCAALQMVAYGKNGQRLEALAHRQAIQARGFHFDAADSRGRQTACG